MIRSHEVRQQGYSFEQRGKLVCGFILLLDLLFVFLIFILSHLQYTVFSAPNYCDDSNKGGYLHLRGSKCEIKYNQFTGVPAPKGKQYYSPVEGASPP